MKARLVESREIGPEVRHFVFEAPELARLDFAPGQFLSLTAMVGEREITRAYSTASAPNGNRFELCLNRVREGMFSPYLFDLRPGEEVEMKGPYGTFTLRPGPGDALLIATGTGIAPVRAILQDALLRERRRFRLLFGVRYEAGILYRKEFEAMAREHANFDFRPSLSRPAPGWKGLTGHVQAHLSECLAGLAEPQVYICGLKAMVDDVRGILKAQGFDRRRVVYEKYD